MAEQKNKYQLILSPRQINQLTAIYEDYMYSVRQYERSLQMSSVDLLASFRMEQLYHETKPNFPWRWEFLNRQEKQEFHYKNSDGNLVKAQFKQLDNGTQILLSDGTKILLQGADLAVTHKGKVLTYDNRHEFAATYENTPTTQQPTINHYCER